MINTEKFKNLLKPIPFAKFIIGITVISMGAYSIAYSDVENYNSFPFSFFDKILQFLLGVFFILIGIEELKKPNGKKWTTYLCFGVVFVVTLINIARYLR